jgi:hypothetical protein
MAQIQSNSAYGIGVVGSFQTLPRERKACEYPLDKKPAEIASFVEYDIRKPLKIPHSYLVTRLAGSDEP